MDTYPMPAPADDGRFTFGLVLEFARVLERHGYPPIASETDLMRLSQSIFGFLYRFANTDQEGNQR